MEFYITPIGRLVKTTKWPKVLECRLMKSEKQFKINERQNTLYYKQFESRPSFQRCLYFQDFEGSKLVKWLLSSLTK